MMALTYTPELPEIGKQAPDFSLPVAQGGITSLSDFKDSKALLVIFMCNHCPYVIAIQDRLNQLAKDFQGLGLGVVGISSNDPDYRVEDSFDAMKIRAKETGYVFPYAFDETQQVAKAYGALCTPDPFLFQNVNGEFKLVYRGRIDDSWKDEAQVKTHDLRDAVNNVLNHKPISSKQIPSMGCSIKWKAER
jgi:peroxiredoxin